MAKKYHGMHKQHDGKMMREGGNGMLREDMSKPSNLPQDVMMNEYPRIEYIDARAEDSLSAVDAQMSGAVKAARKQIAKTKY